MDYYITEKDDTIYLYSMNQYNHIIDFYPIIPDRKARVGDIYVGRVESIKSSINAAFIDIGMEKNAFLPLENIKIDLKAGQPILVQLTKEGKGSKGPTVSSSYSIKGVYSVYLSDTDKIKYSKKLSKDFVEEFKKELRKYDYSNFLIRTNAKGADPLEILEEMDKLSKIGKQIKEKFQYTLPTKLVLKADEEWLRFFKDIYDDGSKVYTNSQEVYSELTKEYGLYAKKNLIYSEKDYFLMHDIKKALKKCLSKKVWLPSGGSLVIEKTEAMYIIDVNTSKFTASRKAERIYRKTNLEAAKEISRQIRYRNLSGIILIDFINMKTEEYKREVIDTFISMVKEDRINTSVHGLTKLGILEVTRERKRPSNYEIIPLLFKR